MFVAKSVGVNTVHKSNIKWFTGSQNNIESEDGSVSYKVSARPLAMINGGFTISVVKGNDTNEVDVLV
jgi:hypothetical protein